MTATSARTGRCALAAALAATLAGCGQRGPLYLPTDPPPLQPVPASAEPAPVPVEPAPDTDADHDDDDDEEC